MYKAHHKVIVLLWVFLGLLASCDRTIHEYPHPKKSQVIIEPHIDRNPPLYYKEVVYNEKWQRSEKNLESHPSSPYTLADRYSLRLIIDIYRCNPTRITPSMRQEQLVDRRVIELDKDAMPPQDTLHTYLNDGNYCILAWADYVRKGDLTDIYYSTNTLLNIHSNIHNYPPDRHLKSAAAGRQSFNLNMNLGPEGYPILPNSGVQTSRIVPVMLSRPMARYKIVASDYNTFVKEGGKLQGATVKVLYKQYVSVGYDVSIREPNEFLSTYRFETPVLNESTGQEGETVLVGDYLFTSFDKEDNIIADLCFFDANGKEISRCSNVEIPLKRNQETIVKGPFLTKKIDNGGQVAIDENFEGEHIVEI